MAMTDFCTDSNLKGRLIDSGRLFAVERQSWLAELRPNFAPVSCFIGQILSDFHLVMKEHIFMIFDLFFTYSTSFFCFYVCLPLL